MDNFLEKKLSYKLIGIFINISRTNGCHFKENIYYNLLKNSFIKNELLFLQFPKIEVFDHANGNFLGYYYPDFLIENKIILEVKACSQIHRSHIDQLVKYLESSMYEVGFIVNFGTERAGIVRKIYSNSRKLFANIRR